MEGETRKGKPHRLSRGSPRGALAGASLASGEKCATVIQVAHNTSGEPGKRAGDRKNGDGIDLRIGSVNVGTLRGRSDEVVDMARRRNIDFCCLQETRWKGKSARVIGGLYKLFWMGCEEGVAGVGIMVAQQWIDHVFEVKRVNERIIMVRIMIGKTVVNIVSVYAPQVGRAKEEKEDF